MSTQLYPLFLHGKRIFNAADIKNEFDLPALRGYLQGNMLLEWLDKHGGKIIADRIRRFDLSEYDTGDVLTAAFFTSGLLSRSKYILDDLFKNPGFSNDSSNLCPFTDSDLASHIFMGNIRRVFYDRKIYSGCFRTNETSLSSGSYSDFLGSGSFGEGSFGSGSFSSFGSFGMSFSGIDLYNPKNLSRHFDVKINDKTMLMTFKEFLDMFPLNKHGYGLHLI